MLHDVSFDKRQASAGLVVEDVHRHVERRILREEGLEQSIFVAEKRLAGHLALVPGAYFWGNRAMKGYVLLEKQIQLGSLGGGAQVPNLASRNKQIAAHLK